MSGAVQGHIEDVICSLSDPERVAHSAGPARAATLNDGVCGAALVLAVLSATDPALARLASRHWDVGTRLLRRSGPDGIYRGPGALAASLVLGNPHLAASHRRNADTQQAVRWLSARAAGLARHQHERRLQGRQGTPWAVYDAIKGLAGIGRILLVADQTGHREIAEPGLRAALTTLSTMINTSSASRPGWWLSRDEHPAARAIPVPDSGAATTGLAHGIAGPLALLAIAAAHGHTVPGQHRAIGRAAHWLLNWRADDGTWPAHISGGTFRQPAVPASSSPSRRDAWCYGSAGIGNALLHAGSATHDEAVTAVGRAALNSLADRPFTQWDTTGPGICHGSAGVLLAASAHHHWRLARRARRATVAQLAEPPHHTSAANSGLLTGAAGVALALSGCESRHTRALEWTALLLLS